ncbi:avidin/streptavidin family protein [Dyella caseinilytica]|uniref:Avidin family protein n=1 Tax=Dyella caseinilytica TaxID=1849581 RepID=A0ABX7GYA2_9GAMM|nr:avidin/streptavidin family protein [Dyella caseinilytica]QRN55382.1 hypothetical protein ISN74_08695 [Dyella caseinilytica]
MKHAELTVAKASTATPKPFNFNGRWTNELTSYMDLVVQGSAISGTYHSAVGDPSAPPKKPLTGSVSGDLISFTVNWGDSITTWIGHGVIDDQGHAQIETLWQIALAVQDETNPQVSWKTVLAGADQFSQ